MAARAVHVKALEAPRLHLRRLVNDDMDALVQGANNINVARYTALIPHPYTQADAREFLDGALLDHNAHTRHVFGIETRLGRDLIGCIEVNMGEGGDTFGYWIAEDHWGQGYATEATYAMQRFAFEIAGKKELCAAVHPDNPASARVLEKTGFVYDRIETGLPGRCTDIEAQVFVLKAEDWFAQEAKKPKLLVSAVALVNLEGSVLMATRPPGKALAGLWEFPGGKVHDDETPEQALVRELREELAISVHENDLTPLSFASHPYEHFHLIMPLYLCRSWQGEVTALEGQSLKWVKPSELSTLAMPPADIPLVAMLKDLL